MKLIRFKKRIGLCQCKGCLDWYSNIIDVYPDDNSFYYSAFLCEYHALEAINEPFITIGRF